MGIYFDFGGHFKIEPALSDEAADAFNTLRPYQGDEQPRFWPWVIGDENAVIEACQDDELKNIGDVEEVNIGRIVRLLHRTGHRVSGTIYCSNSEEDRWCYKAHDDGTVTLHWGHVEYKDAGMPVNRKGE